VLKRQKSKLRNRKSFLSRNPIKKGMDMVCKPKVFRSRRNDLLDKIARQEITEYFNNKQDEV
jgi:hypothetical protein